MELETTSLYFSVFKLSHWFFSLNLLSLIHSCHSVSFDCFLHAIFFCLFGFNFPACRSLICFLYFQIYSFYFCKRHLLFLTSRSFINFCLMVLSFWNKLLQLLKKTVVNWVFTLRALDNMFLVLFWFSSLEFVWFVFKLKKKRLYL